MSHGHDTGEPAVPRPATGVRSTPPEPTVPPVPTGGASEEAEHALHHSHNPFDRQVAMTMIVIAALLAGVKVIGHRAHNHTLSLQIERGAKVTEMSDKWAEFQAQKGREHQYTGFAEHLFATNAVVRKQIEEALQKGQKSESSREGEGDDDRAVRAWARLDPKDLPDYESRQVVQWSTQVKRYVEKGKELRAEAEKLSQEALELSKESEKSHHQTYFFDLGELFVELSLVLSSVAILTKRMPFWFAGIGVCLLGLVIAVMGFTH
jgi:hypothetical protein